MKRLLPILCLLSACSAPVPTAISDTMEMDSGLVLASVVVDGWRIEETSRPHLCHHHRRHSVTAPTGESMVVVVAPSELDGKPAAVGLRSRGWDDRMMPANVHAKLKAFIDSEP